MSISLASVCKRASSFHSAPGHRNLIENLFRPWNCSPAYAPLSHPSTSAPSAGTNPYQQKSGQEKIISILKGNLTIIYWGKWQFWLSCLYTASTLFTFIYGQQKTLIFLGVPCHGNVRCTLILQISVNQFL